MAKKPRTAGGPGATKGVRREAKDPMVHFGYYDEREGGYIGGAERASQLRIDPADVSPLNSPDRKAARAAATEKFDRTLDKQRKRQRRDSGGVYSPNRYRP